VKTFVELYHSFPDLSSILSNSHQPGILRLVHNPYDGCSGRLSLPIPTYFNALRCISQTFERWRAPANICSFTKRYQGARIFALLLDNRSPLWYTGRRLQTFSQSRGSVSLRMAPSVQSSRRRHATSHVRTPCMAKSRRGIAQGRRKCSVTRPTSVGSTRSLIL
jgi:hypothetical protein